ncbi:MAG: DUF4129 domain-containing protein [bacterium]
MKPTTANLLILALALVVSVALINLVQNLRVLSFEEVVIETPIPSIPSLGFDPFVLVLGMGLTGAAIFIVGFLKYRPRGGRFPFGELIPIVLAVVVLVALAILVEPTPPDEVAEEGEEETGTGEETGAEEPGFGIIERLQALRLVPGMLPLILAFVAVVAIYFLIANFRVRRAFSEEELARRKRALKTELTQAMEEHLYTIRTAEDVRSAILTSYRDMVNLFYSYGLRSGRHLTAREVETLARESLGLSDEASEELRRLFEVARYSPHPLGDGHRAAAIESLNRVKRELGA